MKIDKVWFDENNTYVVIDSGHTIGNPLEWFTRLKMLLRNNVAILKSNLTITVSTGKNSTKTPSLESFFDFKRQLNYAKI
jgi:hypothetical protein